MKKWTQKNLQEEGYKILNMMVENVDIVMRDSVAMLQMVVKSTDHHYIYGGYLGAEGLESILKIMDVIGAKAFSDIKGRYIRVAVKGCSNSPKIVGNILQDRWFDIESFLQQYLQYPPAYRRWRWIRSDSHRPPQQTARPQSPLCRSFP